MLLYPGPDFDDIAEEDFEDGVGNQTATTQAILTMDGIPGPTKGPAKGLDDPQGYQVIWYDFYMKHFAKVGKAGVHQGSGRIVKKYFEVVIFDKETTGIFNAATQGAVNKLVKVGVMQRLGETVEPLMIHELHKARIVSFQQGTWGFPPIGTKPLLPFFAQFAFEKKSLNDFDNLPIVVLKFAFEKIVASYTPAGTDGTVGGAITQGFNFNLQALE